MTMPGSGVLTLGPSFDRSFINQGRLDREYLRFVWLYRTLEDKDTYSAVKLDDESFESMLTTVIKCLFIYRSHAERGDDREWFVVPARLPEYGNEKVLEDKIWYGEVVVQTTATFQRSHAPRGIIDRFPAFSASKIMYSGECWQHGAHIRWENGHEVLVCATSPSRKMVLSLALPFASRAARRRPCVFGRTSRTPS